MAKTVQTSECIEVHPMTNLVRIDGAPVCQVLVNESNGRVWLRFMDGDKYRNQARGDRFIDIPLDVFVQSVKECS